jgi:HD domain
MATPVLIGGVSAPDSSLSRKATSLAEQVHSKALLHHVHRTWWFGEFIGKRRGLVYDRELVYVASLLHDLGLTEEFNADNRFEVDSEDSALRFRSAKAYQESKAELVWDTIALHSSADILDRRQPEIALVHFGAHVDVFGLRLEEITPSLVDDVLAVYPRIGMKAAFSQSIAEMARKTPYTALGGGWADVGHRLVRGFECPNICDLINNGTFDS